MMRFHQRKALPAMKKSAISDPRFLKADVALDAAMASSVSIQDQEARSAVVQLTEAVRQLRSVLIDWEADENGWKRPSDGG